MSVSQPSSNHRVWEPFQFPTKFRSPPCPLVPRVEKTPTTGIKKYATTPSAASVSTPRGADEVGKEREAQYQREDDGRRQDHSEQRGKNEATDINSV